MIINKIDNYYIIKIFNNKINIYNTNELEELTKKVIIKTNKKYKLDNSIHLEIYPNNNYGLIIKLKDYKPPYKTNKNKTVKITIHTDSAFLYQIEYFDIIKHNITKDKIYYYKNKFYIKTNDITDIKDYYKLLELSEVIYEDTDLILDKGIKI